MNETSSKTSFIPTLCRMCGDRCAITVECDSAGRAVNIDAFPDHPRNRGRICNKAGAAIDVANHSERILKPLRKTDGGWCEVELQTALDEIAERIGCIRECYGSESLAVWKGEGVGFNQQEGYARRFCRAVGSPNYLSNDSMCFCGRYIGHSLVYGSWPQADFRNAQCILVWGSNPPASHPPINYAIMDGCANGAKLIVVDPRLSTIARQADLLVTPRPGTDGALAWGLINTMIANGWYDRDFVAEQTLGFDALANYAVKFTPAVVEAETGVEAETLQAMVTMIHQASPRLAQYVGCGVELYDNGIDTIRAIAYLIALSGSLDIKGGGFLPESLELRSLMLEDEIPLQGLTRVDNDKYPVLHDFRGETQTIDTMNAILTGDPYPLKGMILTGANPALTNPNSPKVEHALAGLELLVVRELFMTETAELADYILPAASFLERSEVFCHAPSQTVTLTNRAFTIPGVQDEYDFWHDLAHRLGHGEYFPWRDEDEVNAWLLEPTGISVNELASHPEGMTYKPLRYHKWSERPLATPSGKVEFSSEYLQSKGHSEIGEYRPPYYISTPEPDFPFVLISGARKAVYCHSRGRNISRFLDEVPGPRVEIHPDDALRLGVAEGDKVVIRSRCGQAEFPVEVMADNEIMPGYVQATHGWKEAANINQVTFDDKPDPISGFPTMRGVPVQIERA
jgi:anaerobic selenocysteine-containing dehydrogenase